MVISPFTSNKDDGVVVPIPTFPDLETNNKLVDPETTVNEPVPVDTEADTMPVAI